MMRSLLEDSEAERLPFIGSATIDTPVPELAHRIARQINFDLNKFRQQNTVEDAFSYLRSQIEKYVGRAGKYQLRRTQVERDTRVGDIVLRSELGEYVLLVEAANNDE